MKCYRMLLLPLCTLLFLSSVLSLPVADTDLDLQFKEWKKTHDKVYSTPEEEAERRAIWEKTRKRVEAHNKEADQGLHSFWMGMNHFSDLVSYGQIRQGEPQ
ncbi:protein CTLA-2-beta-like [Eucyclogobius newberryi]|uniref:protein CTLA-2-beta-like n=1 Tax=Eucyclogobius newberryi TaxID=166745 RepID=UPI003B5AF170